MKTENHNGQKLFEIIGNIDDDLIIEADMKKNNMAEIPKSVKKFNTEGLMALVAGFGLIGLFTWGVFATFPGASNSFHSGDTAEVFPNSNMPSVTPSPNQPHLPVIPDISDVDDESDNDEIRLSFDRKSNLTRKPAPELRFNLLLQDVVLKGPKTVFPNDVLSIETTVHNNSNYAVSFGLGYAIDYFDGDVWQEIPNDNLAVAMVILSLEPNETYQLTQWVNALNDYDFTPGLYRIRIGVALGLDAQSHDIVFEFELE